MAEAHDPLWQAPADHIKDLGIRAEKVLAPSDYRAVLPGCGTRCTAPRSEELEALVLHKGNLGEMPGDAIVKALDEFAPTFANEVFVVFTKGGEPLEDQTHVPSRDWFLSTALNQRSTMYHIERPERMAASYVGHDRVLVETAYQRLMLVSGNDTGITPHLIRDGYFDRAITDMIRECLKPGMTFLDIGANFGTYTLIGADAVGHEGRVIAVEPAGEIGYLLKENVAMNGYGGTTSVERCAVGDEPGRLTLYEFSSRQGGNTVIPVVAQAAQETYGETVNTRDVPCRTLDEIVESHGLERVDLMKIDVEGFEYQAFLGARGMLKAHRPRIIMEWLGGFYKDREEIGRALWDLLTGELGYDLRRIEGNATTRPITYDELSQIEHSDLLAEPKS
ncbi:FkbM family methyltransferase [Qipengyuania sp. S6317L1]|uniref:FkbM family methyltransferase n=1 Tax=Qipengyuania sp. S6317L1 TaxID=2926410 RepID=UPI001FF27447|nr:FkbM family methyltransferase [Qipengyuania sp. S6317L1]MCK0098073.1 FkbM family methyltransferase [Qipengyuania sp. S6317L1]